MENEKILTENTTTLGKKMWVDKSGNIWTEDKFTYEEALENSKSLVNCKFCMNSSYLTDCYSCDLCKNMVSCVSCFGCSHCEKCDGLEYCKRCVNVKNSYGCEDCIDCNHLYKVIHWANNMPKQ